MEFIKILEALQAQEQEMHPDGTVVTLEDVANQSLPELSERDLEILEEGVTINAAERVLMGTPGSTVILETFYRGVALGRMVERMED